MALSARSMWSGFLRFGMVSIPVKAYTTTVTGGAGIALNQLHKDCHARVQYKKTCPVHGDLKADEIVSGYEFDKDQYVVVDPEEVDKLRTPAEKALNVAAFVPPEAFDPRYYNGKHYFLMPANPVGQRPYALLVRAMRETGRVAFAQVVMRQNEQAVLVRPMGDVLVMSTLAFEQELKDFNEFNADAPKVDVPPAELTMAKSFIDLISKDAGEFDYPAYRDTYADKLRQLIEAKMGGKEVVTPPAAADVPEVTNLMEALQRSLAEAQQKASGKKPPKLNAPSAAAGKAAAARKRKTS